MTKQISQKQQVILNEIVPIVADKLGVSIAEVTMDANFVNNLGADSLDLVELMMDVERSFSLDIPDSQQEEIQTVGDMVRLVDSMNGKLRSGTAKNAVISKTTTVPTKTVAQPKKNPAVNKQRETTPQDLLEMKVKEVFDMPVGQALKMFMQLRQAQK